MKFGPTRRKLLALAASGSIIGGSGCLGFGSDRTTENSTDTENDATDTADVNTIPEEPPKCDPTDYPSLATAPLQEAWSPIRGNLRRTGENDAMEPLGLEDIDTLQGTQLIEYGTLTLPVVVDGTVYVADGNGFTHAIDTDSGDTEWKVETGMNYPPLVTRDTVYCSGGDVSVHAVDRETGSRRWLSILDTESDIGTPPIVAAGKVIVGYYSGIGDDIHGGYSAVNGRCGSGQWSFSSDGERAKGLATDGETVYASTDHHLYAIDAEDGVRRWRTTVTHTLERDAPPVIVEDTAILTEQLPGPLQAIKPEDGTERWSTRGEHNAKYPPTVGDETVHSVDDETDHIHAFDLETGEQRWEFTHEQADVHTPPTLVGDKLYTIFEPGSSDAALLVLQAETGEKHTTVELTTVDSHVDYSRVPELAITPDGIFTHSSGFEGPIPDAIHRFVPQ